MPRELTNAQLSSKLNYRSGQTPSFLLKLQRQVAGYSAADEDEPTYVDSDGGEFERGASGRPDIPRRPPVPRRPSDQPGSGDEKSGSRADGTGELDEDDEDEERPQVVVLKEGKHLSQIEVENEKRKAKGLPPLPDRASVDTTPIKAENSPLPKSSKPKDVHASSSSASSVQIGPRKSVKRKVVSDQAHDALEATAIGAPEKKEKHKNKKQKKTLLSFGDET